MTVRDEVLYSYHPLICCHPVITPTVITIATPIVVPARHLDRAERSQTTFVQNFYLSH
jgi:hypothetical protein